MHWQGFGSCHLRWHAWERRLSLAHLRGCCCYMLSSSLLLSPHLYSWERKLWQKPAPAVFSTSPLGQPPGVCSLSLSHSVSDWHTHKHAHSRQTHTARLSFLALGLEMGRWAEKVCHQQKRTEWEDMTDRLEEKIDRLHVSEPGGLSSFHRSIPPPPPILLLLPWPVSSLS